MSILENAKKLRLRAEELKAKDKDMSMYEAYLKAAKEINEMGE